MNPIDIISRIVAHPLKIEVLRTMIAGGDARTGREWARLTRMSPPSLLSHLRTLVDEGIVIRATVGKSYTFRLNTQNIVVKDMLFPLFGCEKGIVASFGKALQSGLDSARLVTIVLYGSIARGEATSNSDWDILVLCRENADIDILKTQLRNHLPVLRSAFASTIDAKIFTARDFCARYHRGDAFAKGVYMDFLHSIVTNPLYGDSLTKVLEAYGQKDQDKGV